MFRVGKDKKKTRIDKKKTRKKQEKWVEEVGVGSKWGIATLVKTLSAA